VKNHNIANPDTFVLSSDCIHYRPCVWGGGGGGCYNVIFWKVLLLGFLGEKSMLHRRNTVNVTEKGGQVTELKVRRSIYTVRLVIICVFLVSC
jgi:hypothetical protein